MTGPDAGRLIKPAMSDFGGGQGRSNGETGTGCWFTRLQSCHNYASREEYGRWVTHYG